jgi:hypothetical protein
MAPGSHSTYFASLDLGAMVIRNFYEIVNPFINFARSENSESVADEKWREKIGRPTDYQARKFSH